jgi:hypothetical protein
MTNPATQETKGTDATKSPIIVHSFLLMSSSIANTLNQKAPAATRKRVKREVL